MLTVKYLLVSWHLTGRYHKFFICIYDCLLGYKILMFTEELLSDLVIPWILILYLKKEFFLIERLWNIPLAFVQIFFSSFSFSLLMSRFYVHGCIIILRSLTQILIVCKWFCTILVYSICERNLFDSDRCRLLKRNFLVKKLVSSWVESW